MAHVALLRSWHSDVLGTLVGSASAVLVCRDREIHDLTVRKSCGRLLRLGRAHY
jgi:hypothetical protein